MHLRTIISTENIQLENIKPSAITCNVAFDNFTEALTDTEWNRDGREDALNHKKRRDCPIGIHAQSACKSIADLCEGLPCGRSVEEAEEQDIFIIDSGMYMCWYSTHMLHWMRTIIQTAASSRLDLTNYCEDIITVAAAHREAIVKHHNKFTQILGQDIMQMVDLVLNIAKHEETLSGNSINSATTAGDAYDLTDNMTVYFYLYLIQLVAIVHDLAAHGS